jgi:hypothetical protein
MKIAKLLLLLMTTSACVGTNEQQIGDVFGISDTKRNKIPGGCVNAKAIDQTRIQIDYEFPSEVTTGKIHANKIEVASIPSPGEGSIIITNLLEGLKYDFNCFGVINGVTRESEDSVSSKVINRLAPQFDGLKKAELRNPGYVKLNWDEPGAASSGQSALAAYFKIRTFRGASINAELEIYPHLTAFLGQNELIVGQFGDEIDLTFQVSACTFDNICDSNTKIQNVSIPQYMAPLNTKAVAAEGVSGEKTNGYNSVRITTNWDHSANFGGLAKRHLFVSEVNELSTFTNYKTEILTSYNPEKSILFSNAEEGKTYYFIVRGEDRVGQIDNNNNIISYTVPDLTPANFAGLNSLSLGDNKENTVIINFNTIKHSPNDVIKYRLYYTSKSFVSGIQPANACSAKDASWKDYSSALFIEEKLNEQIVFNEAIPRSVYSFCLKTLDFSGNISKTTTSGSITTLDTTAPVFSGAQNDSLVFNNGSSSINPNTLIVKFSKSISLDVSSYKIKFSIKEMETQVVKEVTTVLSKDLFLQRCPGNFCATTYTLSDNIFSGNQEIKVQIQACDDANLLPLGVQNCTTTTNTSNIVSTGDLTGPNFASNTLRALSDAEGKATLNWTNPIPSAGKNYHPSQLNSFKIYLVDTALDSYQSLLARTSSNNVFSVNCNAGLCPSSITISGLEPFSYQTFVAIAFDDVGNPSPMFNLSNVLATTQILDSTPPFFTNTNLSSDAAALKVISPIAYDNQSENGTKIYYQVYFKKDLDFSLSELSDPSLVSGIIQTQSFSYQSYKSNSTSVQNLSFDVPVSNMQVGTYYFTVCSRDESQNKNCIKSSSTFILNDTIAPVFELVQTRSNINLQNLRMEKEKVWRLAIKVEDPTANNGLNLKIWRNDSDSANHLVNTNGAPIINESISSGVQWNSSLLSALENKENWYAHFQIRVWDGYNTVERKLTVKYSTKISIESFRPRTLKSLATTTVAIKGVGFSKATIHGIDSNVIIDGTPCEKLTYVSEKYLLCKITPKSSGAARFTVSDSTNSISIKDLTVGAQDSCINSGNGLYNSPTIICSVQEFLNLLSDTTNGFSSNKFFKLGANLDFTGYTISNRTSILGSANTNEMKLDGDGFFLSNLNILPTNQNGATAIFSLSSKHVKIANLNLLNIKNATSPTTTLNSVLIGSAATTGQDAGSNSFDNIGLFQSKIVGYAGFTSGGLIGSGHLVSFNNIELDMEFDIMYSAGQNQNSSVGALAGIGTFTNISGVNGSVVINGDNTAFSFSSAVGGLMGVGTTSSSTVENISLETVIVPGKSNSNLGAISNAGGLFGRLNLVTNASIQSSSIKFNLSPLYQASTSSKVGSVGGLIGQVTTSTTGAKSNLRFNQVLVNDSNLTIRGTSFSSFGDLGIGGFVGTFTNLNASLLSIVKSRIINSTFNFNNTINLGGFVGAANTNNISYSPFNTEAILSIEDSFTQITISGSSFPEASIGGLFGTNKLSYSADILLNRTYTYNCYQINDNSRTGGLVSEALHQPFALTVNNSYFNQSHAENGCSGKNTSYEDRGIKFNANALNLQATFANFDFTKTWFMNSLTGPELK